MIDKSKAVPGVASTKNGKGTKQGGQAGNIPASNYSRNEKARQGRIERLLLPGKENAISTRQLQKLTGINSVRNLRAAVAAEREKGIVILSSKNGGYYLPSAGEKGRKEISAFVATMTARAISTLQAVRSAQTAMKADIGQTGLMEYDGKEENGDG